jgi:hypothetical protein
MTEVEKDFHQDCRTKKSVAASARSRRTHAGKGGKVRLPHDNLTKKELEKMNGECKAYRLNSPMKWEEFKSLPDDLKVAYIKMLREKYNAPTKEITAMLGVSEFSYGEVLRKLGFSDKPGLRRKVTDEWFAWLDGKKMEEPVEEKEPVAEGDTCDLADARPDWKGLYEAMYEQCREMADEIEGLRRAADELRKENADLLEKVVNPAEFVSWDYHNRIVEVLEAKLEIVELIFGKR